MKQYLDLVEDILTNGVYKDDRTGTGTLSIFGTQTKYDLREGFPLVTTKKVNFNAIVRELLWMLSGSTNIHKGLSPHTKIWDEWADENGDLGPIYGKQWRNWTKFSWDDTAKKYVRFRIDQIQDAIDLIKTNPDSRRIIVSAWNPADIDKMALPPCHAFFQFYVNEGRLDCQLYQRSADIALGVPFNIASYALLMILIARECALVPGIFTHTLGDAHIYTNHIEGLKEQLERKPFKSPTVVLNEEVTDIDLVFFEDIFMFDYTYHPVIKFPIAV